MIVAMADVAARRRAGRPRIRPSAADVPAREEILDAAASLFVRHGVAATTTRQIAQQVGIAQASLYYYFRGKDEMLQELLIASVRPTLTIARALEGRPADAASRLWALAVTDVQTLTRAPHNIASLYLLPEVQGPDYEPFAAERAELQAVYARLGRAAGSSLDETLTGTLIMQLVESVIHLRRAGELQPGYAPHIAAACLRLAGLSPEEVAAAGQAGERLLAGNAAGQPVLSGT